jgi:23S rRNA pseudouridine2605 synthase
MKPRGGVPLNRALSKMGILSRAQAIEAIRNGRVSVDGRIVRNPAAPVVPERARIEVDREVPPAAPWRTILFHKPRGVMTTRRDPQGRPTVYDVIGEAANGLVPVGRLDLATSGLLLLTSDTRLASWITDPANAVPRVYTIVARGRVDESDLLRLTNGLDSGGERLRAESVTIRKASGRESHLLLELREGKNREVRRLCEAIGHEVTRLKRIRLGGLELGSLEPGEWRALSPAEVSAAFRSGGL